ncbi:MAG: hypothetical protein V7745_02480 [Pseudomonadales bacterium]
MWSTLRTWLLGISAVFVFSFSGLLQAGDDPSIQGNLRDNIKESMNHYIAGQTINERMYLFDALEGKLLKMELVELHEGIVKKGDFYVSCADFVDQHGNAIDVDFLVRAKLEQLITTQAIVHSVDGNKRKYHLEKL